MNPVKKLRLTYNLTQPELASLAGVSLSVVSRTEAGTFNSIPPSILDAVKKMAHHSDESANTQALSKAYSLWVKAELQKVKLPIAMVDLDYSTTPEQFVTWMKLVCHINNVPGTEISFAQLFKVNIYIVSKFAKGQMARVPQQLLERNKTIRAYLSGGVRDNVYNET